MTNKKVVAKECRFVTYVPPPYPGARDLHYAKEIVHYSDGTSEPKMNEIWDWKRSIYVTKPNKRNHKSKKEWEDIANLQEYRTRQADIVQTIARALDDFKLNGSQRSKQQSPYVYGSDILSTALIKRAYAAKYPIEATKYRVGVFDVETDVVFGTKEVIMASFTSKEVVHTAVIRRYFQNHYPGHSEDYIRKKVEELTVFYLGDLIKERGITPVIEFVDTPVQAIKSCFDAAHRTKPDFMTIWNMEFDVQEIIKECDKEGVDPKEIFSDPTLPPEYKYFKFIKGPNKKKTASGKETPIKPANRWHTVIAPASFYVIDSMCAYRHLRLSKQELQSYKLDAILHKELKRTKLKFDAADAYSRVKWHIFMQSNYPLEYIVYNRFDCIGVELLDEKTNDLAVSLPMFSGYSDFQNFKSQPRRIVDDLHFLVQEEEGKIIGSTGEVMTDLDDEDTTELSGLIITLDAHLVSDNGHCIIEEAPDVRSNIRTDVADLDVEGSYPNGQSVFNISKETTVKELISIDGVDHETSKLQCINLSGGQTNAMEFCQLLMGFPTHFEMLEEFDKQFGAQAIDNTVTEEKTMMVVPVLKSVSDW